MEEIIYSYNDLKNLKYKYVKIICNNPEGGKQEICTKTILIGEVFFQIYIDKPRFKTDFPQEITIKFATEDAVYISKTILKDIKKAGLYTCLTTATLKNIERKQDRRFKRINSDLECCDSCIDKNENEKIFSAKLINLSACGMLISHLQPISDKAEDIHLQDYSNLAIVARFIPNYESKISVNILRIEKDENELCKYAFNFIESYGRNIDIVNKHVTQKQI